MALALSQQHNVPVDDGRPKSDNPFEDFFGPLPPGLVNTSAGAAYPHESYALPFAYQGRNLFLSSVLDFLITSNDNFLISEICPVVQTDEIHVAWNTFKFDRVMADYEPEFGMPRFVTAESSSSSDSLARRGLAMQLEYGFWKTPLGRQHYLMNLQQIQEACLETLHYGVVHAILSAKNEWRSWLMEHGSIGAPNNIKHMLKTRKQEWAIVQRDPKGMFLLDAQIKDHMRSRGIVPDRWLLAPRTAMYFTMVSDFQTEYYRRGPKADANLQQGAEAMTPFRGTQVREVRKFDMDFCNKPSCPLSRPRSIGSYYIMEPKDKQITLYDMDKDCWVTLQKQDICKAAGLENDDGTKRLLIMRFAETYQMGSGVLVKSGEEFGNTFVGNSDMMLSDNALSKTHIGHFTYYSKTVIRRPELAYIAEDIFAEDYIGGEGTKVYNKDQLDKDMMEGRIGTHNQKADMVAVWLEDASHVCNPIDVRGCFDPEMTSSSECCFKPLTGGISAQIINTIKNNLATANNFEEEAAFRVPFARCNVYCYKGAYACKQDASSKCVMHPNTGFWGPDVYAGCREARTGNLVQLQTQKRGCTDDFCCPPPEPVYNAENVSCFNGVSAAGTGGGGSGGGGGDDNDEGGGGGGGDDNDDETFEKKFEKFEKKYRTQLDVLDKIEREEEPTAAEMEAVQAEKLNMERDLKKLDEKAKTLEEKAKVTGKIANLNNIEPAPAPAAAPAAAPTQSLTSIAAPDFKATAPRRRRK